MLVDFLAAQRRDPPSPEVSRDIIRQSLGSLRRHLDMQVAFVSWFDAGQRVIEFVDSAIPAASADPARSVVEGTSDPFEDTYCARVVDGRLAALVTDAQDVESLRDVAATRDLSIRAHLSVPMRDQVGHPFGTLCCFSSEPAVGLRARDQDVLEMFGDLIGSHLRFLLEHDRDVGAVRAEIEEVVARGGPTLVFQPVVDITTGVVYGYEALSRFPSFRDWTPDTWFRKALPAGLGPALEGAVIRGVVDHLASLPSDVVLSVNVSALTVLEDPDFLAPLITSDHPSRLVLEVTEHHRVEDYDVLIAALAPVREAGVRLAVDDAGSGYAGLEHILSLRPEVLKLDRALIEGIADHPGRQAMCEAMVSFAAKTDAVLVAEGVAVEEDLRALLDAGVRYAQGFLLGRPAALGQPTQARTRPTG